MDSRMSGKAKLKSHYSVRISLRGSGGVLYFATERQPIFESSGVAKSLVKAGIIEDEKYGETLIYLDESEIVSITMRHHNGD